MAPLIRYETRGRTAVVTLDRPDRRNALNAELVTQLQEAFAAAAADDGVRVVVLTGAGSAFSAGADLERLLEAGPMEHEQDSRRLAELFEAIYLHPKPVIARINGHAVAGGCGLAAVCDFIVAAEHARFGFPEVRIGFVPAIVAVFLLRKLGETAVRDLLLRGALVDAETARAAGLVTRVVPADALDDAVDALAGELAAETSASAVALTKQLIADVRGMGLREGVAHAVRTNAFARGTADCRAGVAAFLEKRDPPWKTGPGA